MLWSLKKFLQVAPYLIKNFKHRTYSEENTHIDLGA